MERDKINEYQWLDAATRGIRFGPDRAAVRAELAAHLEDKQADLRRIFPDIPPEEAEQRALEAMGDPEEIGRELAKIHKPWLGYLWRVSQVCLLAVAVWLGVLVWNGGADALFWQTGSAFPEETGGVGGFLARSVFSAERVSSVPLPRQQSVRNGEYTFTVEEGTLWTPEGEGSDHVDVQYDQAVHLKLRVEWRRPGELPAAEFDRAVWAQDELGNRYLSLEEYYYSRGNPRWGELQVLRSGIRGCTPLSADYEILVPVCSREAERLELRYTRGGADVTIPIVLRGDQE